MKKTTFLRKIWYSLSPEQRFTIRRFYFLPSDLLQSIKGKKNKYIPSKGAIYTGSPADPEEYLFQGLSQVELLKEYVSLNDTDCVLDIGSGIGRTAVALTTYLDKTAIYEGFDVVKKGVDWCNSKIGKDFPNFNFTYVPLFNDLYNSHNLKASEFTFPYPDNHFDKIFSFSVFTHMGIIDIQHYISEIKRVLKPNGKCFSTFFTYNNESEETISNKKNFSFPFKYEGYRLMDDKVQSGNIAIHEDKLKAMFENSEMKLDVLVDGFWKYGKNRSSSSEYQDIVVFS